MVTEQFNADLQAYQTTLNQHLLRLKEELRDLENRWRSLNEVYEGHAAEEFSGVWNKTLADFQDSVEQTQTLINFLEEISK